MGDILLQRSGLLTQIRPVKVLLILQPPAILKNESASQGTVRANVLAFCSSVQYIRYVYFIAIIHQFSSEAVSCTAVSKFSEIS